MSPSQLHSQEVAAAMDTRGDGDGDDEDEGLEPTVDTESVRPGGGVDADQFEIFVKTRHKRTISETSDRKGIYLHVRYRVREVAH